jgi:hypothetical protein
MGIGPPSSKLGENRRTRFRGPKASIQANGIRTLLKPIGDPLPWQIGTIISL